MVIILPETKIKSRTGWTESAGWEGAERQRRAPEGCKEGTEGLWETCLGSGAVSNEAFGKQHLISSTPFLAGWERAGVFCLERRARGTINPSCWRGEEGPDAPPGQGGGSLKD